MNSEVYRSIRSSQIQLNAKLKRQHNSGQMDYQNLKWDHQSPCLKAGSPTGGLALHLRGGSTKLGDVRGFWTRGFSSKCHPCNAEGAHTYRLIKAFVSFSRKHLDDLLHGLTRQKLNILEGVCNITSGIKVTQHYRKGSSCQQ